jgi:hypothetical protein
MVLANLSENEFDECYAKAQLVAHMEEIAALEAETEHGQCQELREPLKEGSPLLAVTGRPAGS